MKKMVAVFDFIFCAIGVIAIPVIVAMGISAYSVNPNIFIVYMTISGIFIAALTAVMGLTSGIRNIGDGI